MEPVLFLVAQAIAPFAMGLDVVPFPGPAAAYEFSHPVGVFLLRLDKDRLVVDLPFRGAPARVAAEYLESVRGALAMGIQAEDGKIYSFALERHDYFFGEEDRTDYHASTYRVRAAGQVEIPVPPPAPTDTVAAAETAILPREDAAGEDV